MDHAVGLLSLGEKRIQRGHENAKALKEVYEQHRKAAEEKKEALRLSGAQASEPSPVPAAAAAADAKLDEFFETRAPYNFEREDNVKRAFLREDSTDDENLPEVDYCTVCGSSTCWRKHTNCRESNRFELMDHFGRFMVQHGAGYLPGVTGRPGDAMEEGTP